MPLPLNVYSDLLETLYAATLDEAQWQPFLSQLCEATHSVIALLVRNDDLMGRRILASGGSPAPAGEEGYNTADPVRAAFMRKPRVGVIEVEDFLPHERLAASPQYRVMAQVGAEYGTCIVPTVSLRRYELIALWRGGDRPRLEPDLAQLLTMLFPHIQNALRIQGALGVFQERAQTAESILDASPTASFLLSASGRLLYRNKAGQKLAGARDAFIEQGGRIIPTRFERKAEWNDLIAAAAAHWDYPGGAMMLERANGKRPLQVLVSPFRADESKRARRVLALATEPDRAPQFPDTVLRQLYGLTGAETEIANGLLTGFPPEAIAGLRGVSVGTVRSQIKSLFSKTDTRRQADLLRLLHTLPQAHQSSPD